MLSEETTLENEDPVSETLEWFRSNFSHAEKDGRISLKDFQHASHRNCLVRICVRKRLSIL